MSENLYKWREEDMGNMYIKANVFLFVLGPHLAALGLLLSKLRNRS